MVIRDVTEREKIQKDLLDANDNLENKVLERTSELKKLNAKMVDIARSAGMAEVASGVLHNVGNVLNSVNVSTALLKEQIKEGRLYNIEKLAVFAHGVVRNILIHEFLHAGDDADVLLLGIDEQRAGYFVLT